MVVMDIFERMGVRIRSEDVSDIIRMRKKKGDETVKPVIVELKSEYDKWMVSRNKDDLREIEEYKIFRAGSVKRGTRAEKIECAEGKVREKSGTKVLVDSMCARKNLRIF